MSPCAPAEDSGRRRSARAAAQTEEASQAGSDSTASARNKEEHVCFASETRWGPGSWSSVQFENIPHGFSVGTESTAQLTDQRRVIDQNLVMMSDH